MKLLNRTQACAIAFAGLSLTACIDDKYDLSDIDTTARVEVNDLVIPINIGEVKLKNVLSLEDDGIVKELNGQYVLVQDGTFESEPVKIEEVILPAPTIASTKVDISLNYPLARRNAQAGELQFNILPSESSFSMDNTSVSEYIVSIDRVTTSLRFKITMSIPELNGLVSKVAVRDLKLTVPKGLVISSADYDPASGVLNVGNVTSTGSTLSVEYDVTGIDFSKSTIEFDYATHTMRLSDKFGIKSGIVVVDPADITSGNVPNELSLVTDYKMSDIVIKTFTGRMCYSIDGLSVTDVNLNDLPDVLSQSGTDITIVNPQIYINIDNPLHNYGLRAQAGLTISAYKDETLVNNYSLNAPGYFTIAGLPSQLNYSVYMAPKPVDAADIYQGYAGAQYFAFTSLANVISGDGLPTRLAIELSNPGIPEQQVTNFALGQDLGVVKGNYSFYAPLQLGNGSTIVYHDKIDGWGGEDLDHLTVTKLKVTTTISSDFPMALDFTGYPIDAEGKQINGVQIEGARIEANAKDQVLELYITGEITNLDGIEFVAKGVAGASETVLKPTMNITLTTVRATVSGYYEKEL